MNTSPLHFLTQFPFQYSYLLFPFLFLGVWQIFRQKSKSFYPLLWRIIIVYVFFAFIPRSKGKNYVFIVAPFIFLITGLGIYAIHNRLKNLISLRKSRLIIAFSISLIVLSVFKPYTLQKYHFKKGGYWFNEEDKAVKRHNTAIYKQLDEILIEKHVILNCRSFEEIEAMFWSRHLVYAWYPDEQQYAELKKQQYPIAVFESTPQQMLPHYVM